MKIAIVHHWLIKMGGAEKVVENLCDIYPQADIFTHVYDKKQISEFLNKKNIKTTFISKLPLSSKLYKHYLPLMPLALKFLNLKKYDLIICSESGPTKGFKHSSNAKIVCYCHSPMRYIWDQETSYYKKFNLIEKFVSKLVFPYLRKWDIRTSDSLNLIIANSNFISKRINKCWNKKSVVVFPPINLSDFKQSSVKKQFYLVISRHVGYKRIDIAVEAFKILGLNLKIIGDGPETKNLKEMSDGYSNIEFLGWVTDEQKKKFLSESKALIFPGIEDFGITPIESMASGRPVIAFKKGGALDYVKDYKNGIFFNEQSTESLISAIKLFEEKYSMFCPTKIKESVNHFDSDNFKINILKNISNLFKD